LVLHGSIIITTIVIFIPFHPFQRLTMSANTGAGIQELMAAETRASQIVAEARMGEFRNFLTMTRRRNSWMMIWSVT
jgi:hypothetical protein